MKRFWIPLLCMLCLFCILKPTDSSAMEVTELTEPYRSDNIGYDYSSYHAICTGSYLYANPDGTYTRVDCYGRNIYIEHYDAQLNFLSGKTFPLELDLFGGFYQGSEYNFLILGQRNPEEDPNAEVIRIVRFTKDWQRIDAASFVSDNTSDPFRAGTVRCTEYNGYLYIHTAHRMFTYTDGQQHQANLTLNVRIQDMTITDYRNGISDIDEGYVSHSFNQFIAVDGSQLLTVDHGDGAPRAVVLCRYKTPAGQDHFITPGASRQCDTVNVLSIQGQEGANYTGVAVGGFEISDTAYLIAGNTVAQDHTYNSNAQRNIFITATRKDLFSSEGTTIHYLTNYSQGDEVTLSNVHFVKISQNRYLVLWNETRTEGITLCYQFVDGNGNPSSKIYTGVNPLSQCKPIAANGKVIWYVTNRFAPTFLAIDLNDPENLPHAHFYEYTHQYQAGYSYPGLITGLCQYCGAASPDVIIPAVRDCPEEYILTPAGKPAASCTEEGYVMADWIKLDQYRITVVKTYSFRHPALGHDYQTVTTEATCTQDGKHLRTCSRCNDVQEEIIEAKGHQYTKRPYKYATCLKDGSDIYTCTVCADSYMETVPAFGHDYNTHQVVKEPGPTTVGAVHSTCRYCGDLYVSTLAPLSTGVAGCQVILEPTCTQQGIAQYSYVSPVYGTIFIKGTVSATGHRYQSQITAGDCVTDGEEVKTCEICGDTVTEIIPAPGHSFTNGKCGSCGAADPEYKPVVPVITLNYPTLVFEDMILMNIYFSAEQTEDVVQMGLITYPENVSQWNVDNARSVIPGYTWSQIDGCFYATTNGIAAKDLGDEIYFAVYALLTDGSYTYSRLVSYSPSTYAYVQLASGDRDLQALAAAMLNYGAAAQSYFHYRTDKPVNAGLSAAQKALVKCYSPELLCAAELPSTEKQGSLIKNGGYTKCYPTVSFEGAFSINYYFTPSSTPRGNVTMYYWKQEDYHTAQTLTIENATAAIAMTGEGTGQYQACVSGIAAKDLDQGVYVCFLYSDGDTEYCSGVLAYSIGTYCNVMAASADPAAELAKATAVFGYHAKQYITKGIGV